MQNANTPSVEVSCPHAWSESLFRTLLIRLPSMTGARAEDAQGGECGPVGHVRHHGPVLEQVPPHARWSPWHRPALAQFTRLSSPTMDMPPSQHHGSGAQLKAAKREVSLAQGLEADNCLHAALHHYKEAHQLVPTAKLASKIEQLQRQSGGEPSTAPGSLVQPTPEVTHHPPSAMPEGSMQYLEDSVPCSLAIGVGQPWVPWRQILSMRESCAPAAPPAPVEMQVRHMSPRCPHSVPTMSARCPHGHCVWHGQCTPSKGMVDVRSALEKAPTLRHRALHPLSNPAVPPPTAVCRRDGGGPICAPPAGAARSAQLWG